MSRIGKTEIKIPGGVTVNVATAAVTVKGPKGELSLDIPEEITVEQNDDALRIERANDSKRVRQLHGTVRSRLSNMVVGTSNGFERILEIQGVGYRAQLQGKNLDLSLGKSHPIVFSPPDGVELAVDGNTKVIVKGIDKEKVGAAAAKIRSYSPPEPYKGKGIRYVDEYVRRKAGKTVAG